MRLCRWCWPVLLLPLLACHGTRAPARAETMKPGLVASLDDVTNGLQGAIAKDGRDSDVRARPQTFFAESAEIQDKGAEPAAAPATERLLVYRGEIRLEVARPEEAVERFLAVVRDWGGYLQRQSGTTVTVRVPAKQFDAAFALLRTCGRVLAESRSADDVTEEFTDLGIRIENARKSLERLREILQKADKVEEILKVEEQMRRLTEEIERMEGKRKLLADQVAMSTLQAEFRAVAEPPPVRRSRQPSRFAWINAIGAERVMEDF